VRWVGNEAGVCRSSEWSVLPRHFGDQTYWDLGSRKAIMKSKEPLVWHPAEVDVSIRDGWFYHEKQDYSVKPLAKLRDIYYKSVGGNAALLLNVPPNQEGLIAQRDVDTLISLGAQLQIDFKENLAEDSIVTDTCHLDDAHTGQMALEPGSDTYWHSGPFEKEAGLVLDLGDDYDIDKIVLKEHIATGQQIEKFTLYVDLNCAGEGKSKWKKLEEGTVIGHKRIIKFKEQRMRRLKLVIEQARGFATLEAWEAY
jgi:alpha-L-fucosidase